MSLKIVSFNCRGLSGLQKRRDVLNYLKQKNYSICLLQDTHFTDDDYQQVRSFWGYDIFFSPGRSNARGTAILFNNNFEYTILNQHKDEEGNLLILEINIANKYDFMLVNVYGPNKDTPMFYKDVSEILTTFHGEFIITAGDFNLVQDPILDYFNYNNVNNPEARKALLGLKETHGLVDPWRIKYDKRKKYTWSKTNPLKKARLDFFLISNELMNFIDNVNINPGYRSDHAMIELCITFTKFERGRGFWKFNNSLLHDHAYVKLIKDTIRNVKEKYAASPYNPKAIHSIPDDDLFLSIDDQLFFEQLLLEIRGATILFSSRKKKDKENDQKLLEEEIQFLENINDSNSSPDIIEKLAQARNKLEIMRKDYINGIFARNKLKWIEHGEKPTKYFLSLEKRNYVNKTVNKLVTDDGIVASQKDILNEVERFYKVLYSCKDNSLHDVELKSLINPQYHISLDEKTSLELEGSITKEEALLALKKMKNNKSPGSDGFNSEFYKFFWRDLGVYLLRSINYGFSIGELSLTQKQGIISILPKGDKPREYLKNWRPISLLNVSYKIASSCIANRIKKVLDYLIHDNQKGFLQGRFIGENTRIIYDVLHNTIDKHIPGILLLIDFEKAFDSISWRFMYKTLEFFGFGTDLIKWVSVLYKEAKLCVLQNGIFSKFFFIGRGCRQGDPVSPYLFNLCVEIMGLMIRQNRNIKGIRIEKETICLLQYADDTVLFLDDSEKSLKSALDLLFQFSKFSGLKPNINKTKAIWIGSKIGSSESLCDSTDLNWTTQPFTILGITYTANLQDMEQINFDKRLEGIEREILQWSKRQISPLGKITVVKSILLSKLTHLFSVLPKPSIQWMKKLEQLLFKFIWNKKPDKISRKTIQLDFENGGFRMTNLEIFIKSLKLTWLRRMLVSESMWTRLFTTITDCTITHLCHLGSEYITQILKRTSNPFWLETLSYFLEFKNIFNHDILLEPLWYNKRIKVQNKCIFYKSLYNKGFHTISDLLISQGNFISYESMLNDFGVKLPFTVYEGLKTSILCTFPEVKQMDPSCIKRPLKMEFIEILLKDKKGSRRIYDCFISQIQHKPICEKKWSTELSLQDQFNWKTMFRNLKSLSKDIPLIWFQYRIVHRILGVNKYLYFAKIVDSRNCTICSLEPETLIHLFFECNVVKTIWSTLEDWIQHKSGKIVNFSPSVVLLGTQDKDIGLNMIILLVKKYIYQYSRKKCNINFASVQTYITSYYKLEKKLYSNDSFEKRWETWTCLFQ